jgi:hypothetical protein
MSLMREREGERKVWDKVGHLVIGREQRRDGEMR